MSLKSSSAKKAAEQVVKCILRVSRLHFSVEDTIWIVQDGLRGEASIAQLCRKEGVAQSLYYTWSKEFMEAGKRLLAGNTVRAATTTDEVKDLRREASALKECAADLTLKNRLLSGRVRLVSSAK
jgi:transposase